RTWATPGRDRRCWRWSARFSGTRTPWERPPALGSKAALLFFLAQSLHRFGRGDAKELQGRRDDALRGDAQPQASLGQRLIVRNHPAIRVKAMESLGDGLRVMGQAMRPTARGGGVYLV